MTSWRTPTTTPHASERRASAENQHEANPGDAQRSAPRAGRAANAVQRAVQRAAVENRNDAANRVARVAARRNPRVAAEAKAGRGRPA